MRGLEEAFLDLRFALRPVRPPSDEIVLVLIDDASIREVGRWPWSRGQIARVVERISRAGPRTIGIDLLFLEPEPGARPAQWLDALREALEASEPAGESLDLESLGRSLRRLLLSAPGDRALAEAIGEAGNAVIPFSFVLGDADGAGPVPGEVAASAYRVVLSAAGDAAVPRASALFAPIAPLAGAAAGLAMP